MSISLSDLTRPPPSSTRSAPRSRRPHDLFDRALRQFQSYSGDPIATIEEALAIDPRFVLGHVFRALVLGTTGERRFTELARPSVDAAEVLLEQSNPSSTARERGLAAAARALVDGEWNAAGRLLDDVLVDHPREALAIQAAHLIDFFRGDAINLRNRIARVLPHWNPNVPGYSFVLGMYAFGLEECNQYSEAEDAARRALEIEPKDPWAIHAGVHVFEMTGRVDEGIGWLESRRADWAEDNGFAFHNHWHLAVFLLDQQRYADVLALYDRRLHESPPDSILQLVDATALLFRLWLQGIALGDRPAALAENWAARLESERGFYAFNDVHAMMAFTMAGAETESIRLLSDLEWAEQNARGDNQRMASEVGLPAARALRSFALQRYEETIATLRHLRDVASRFGGSHAQRDVLTLTLIEAAIRSGRFSTARHFVAERLVHRPNGELGWRLAGRAQGADQELAPVTVPERERALEVRRVRLPGRCELEYVERGDSNAGAPPVVFLHGVTDSWTSFRQIVERFPRDLRCLAISQRGHGDSERPQSGYRQSDFADDVVAFMDALGIERATLVGHSMGSIVAQTVAAKHPKRVAKLALLGSTTTFATQEVRDLLAHLDTLDAIPRELAHEFQIGTMRLPIPEPMLAAFVDESMKVPLRVWRDAIAGLVEHDGPWHLREIEAPTTLFWGAHDAYCSREEQARLRELIEDCRFVAYDDLGHALHWEDPERVARDLVAFVR